MSENKSAVKNEIDAVETVKFTVDIRGKEIEITAPASIDDAPIEVAELFDEDKSIKGFMALIGPRQAAKLRAAGCRTKDFTAVVEAWQDAAGLGED